VICISLLKQISYPTTSPMWITY